MTRRPSKRLWRCFVTPKRALAQFLLLPDPPLAVSSFPRAVKPCFSHPLAHMEGQQTQTYILLFIFQQMPGGQFCFYCLCTSGGGKQKAACSCAVPSCTSKRASPEVTGPETTARLVSLSALKSFTGQRTAEINCQRCSFFFFITQM